jgi:DNA-directed RNA polymerase II subunit RPB1
VLALDRDTYIEKDVMMNILMWLESWDGTVPTPTILKPKQLWTGKQVFSLIIPRNTNFINADDEEPDMSYTDSKVLIEEGELVSGILNKKTLGTSHKSLVHVIWNEHGSEVCKHFLNQVQHVVNYWLLHQGFSVGVGDTIADEETLAKITQTIRKAKVLLLHPFRHVLNDNLLTYVDAV